MGGAHSTGQTEANKNKSRNPADHRGHLAHAHKHAGARAAHEQARWPLSLGHTDHPATATTTTTTTTTPTIAAAPTTTTITKASCSNRLTS